MIVADALREATLKLADTSSSARLDAEFMMAAALGVTRSEMLMHHMDDASPVHFGDWLLRRKSREPVAYIVGSQEFYGREFKVTPDVLIPRSDSETVVEAMIAEMGGAPTGRVLDLGTGSGALLLTLLAECPRLEGVGVDRSKGAISVAQSNAEAFGLAHRCDFTHWDWHENEGEGDWGSTLGTFEFVIANPPYVETTAELEADVSDYEPAGALFAGSDGLDDYRVIIPNLRSLGATLMVLEIGSAQADATSSIAEANGFSAQVRNDLANRPRALVLRS